MARKSSRTELLAIYRLEFYKKKSDWKLGQGSPKQQQIKKAEVEKAASNETFVISKDHGEQNPIFNDAFFDCEPICIQVQENLETTGDHIDKEQSESHAGNNPVSSDERDTGSPEVLLQMLWDQGLDNLSYSQPMQDVNLCTDAPGAVWGDYCQNANTPNLEWNRFFKNLQMWRVMLPCMWDTTGQVAGCSAALGARGSHAAAAGDATEAAPCDDSVAVGAEGCPSWLEFALGAHRAPHSSELELRHIGDESEPRTGEQRKGEGEGGGERECGGLEWLSQAGAGVVRIQFGRPRRV